MTTPQPARWPKSSNDLEQFSVLLDPPAAAGITIRPYPLPKLDIHPVGWLARGVYLSHNEIDVDMVLKEVEKVYLERGFTDYYENGVPTKTIFRRMMPPELGNIADSHRAIKSNIQWQEDVFELMHAVRECTGRRNLKIPFRAKMEKLINAQARASSLKFSIASSLTSSLV